MSTVQLEFLMMILAGWVNRSQHDVIEYLQGENRVLREQLGGKRLLFTDRQRRRLATKAKAIGRKGLLELRTLVVDPGRLQSRVTDWFGDYIQRLLNDDVKNDDLRSAFRSKFESSFGLSV